MMQINGQDIKSEAVSRTLRFLAWMSAWMMGPFAGGIYSLGKHDEKKVFLLSCLLEGGMKESDLAFTFLIP